MVKNKCVKIVLFILISFFVGFGSSRVARSQSLLNSYQPVVLTGAQVPDFLGYPVNEISLWVFEPASHEWKEVPFQIDQRSPSGSYFTNDDSVLDENDELVFMARDLGIAAGEMDWIPDTTGQNYSRYQIAVADPENPDLKVYGYLYRAAPKLKQPLIFLNRQTGDIYSGQYTIGFGENGLPDKLIIPQSAGGSGQDILDRLKIHVVAEVQGFSGPTQVRISENSIKMQGLKFKPGPVRIIRSIVFKLVVDLGPQLGEITLPDVYYFPIFFYPYSMAVQADSIDLSEIGTLNAKILSVRYSMDLNPNAAGMKFFNPNNAAVLVDGRPDSVNRALSPGLSYQMVTGNQGTVVSLLEVPDVGDQQKLYYCESTTGSTCDGTPDTGDGFSYGDAGFWITGTGIQGVLKFYSTIYMLPGNQPQSEAVKLFDRAQNPFIITTAGQASRVSVSEHPNISRSPDRFQVFPAYPNPFYPNRSGRQTALRYFLPKPAPVEIAIYDITGKSIRHLRFLGQSAGTHTISWNGRDETGRLLPSGVYFYRIHAGRKYITQKLLLVR